MHKQVRTIISAILINTFFVTTFLFSAQAKTTCPPRIPATLLSLYLQSDLIVLADYENEKITKKSNENKHGFYARIEKDLRINKIYKGDIKSKNISYNTFEYRSNLTNSKQKFNRRFLSYVGTVPVRIGEQYLFFLRENSKGKYTITDMLGGIKNSDESLVIYEEKLAELKEITLNKENQIEKVTDWLIKALDEPITRWGAIQDLYNSSNSFAYENKRKKNTKGKKFVFNKSFNSYSSIIAKNLKESHKTKLTNILLDETHQSWFRQTPKIIDYRLIRIVRNWDKARLATDAFTFLQGLDESKFKTKLIVMEFISNVTNDSILRNNYYQYSRIKLGKNATTQSKNLALRHIKMNKFNSRFQTLLLQNFEKQAKH